MLENLREISRSFCRFAENEAEGRSPLYADLSRHIASDEAVLDFLAHLPPTKRQPNLLLASFRSLLGTPANWSDFKAGLHANEASLSARIMERSTQTNEPARCATLLPLLARLKGPLALIEVGAAAGLCLLPERYMYDFYGRRVAQENEPDPPVFRCRASASTPIPDAVPEIVWRAGLDLHPLDPLDDGQMEWLETLVWPGQEERLANLRKAVAIARRSQVPLVRGDLTRDLQALCSQAPSGATTVVFHSAVLAYVQSQAEREQFAAMAVEVADHWIANESPTVFPQIAPSSEAPRPGAFLLSLDGEPFAWTDPHGASIDWLH